MANWVTSELSFSEVRYAPVFDLLEVLPKPADDFLLLAVSYLLQDFVEGKVNDIVVVQFLRGDLIAELEPDPV